MHENFASWAEVISNSTYLTYNWINDDETHLPLTAAAFESWEQLKTRQKL